MSMSDSLPECIQASQFNFGAFHRRPNICATFSAQIFEWSPALEDGTVGRFVGAHGPHVISSDAGSYDINDHVSIYGPILNTFDRKPPFDPLNYAALNYNPTYGYSGIVGRFFNVGVKVKM